ncbi:MAG: DNA-3-methyladenine glycosylase 2 family protein [Clostridiales bacterium]|nr:DNA-3-methyladenine glycosylase 2 family protein [Clostridiales bacterium]
MKFFNYGQKEIDYLKSRDKTLSEYIDKVGYISREINDDLFSSLVTSILGQQISNKAQATVIERLKNKTQINPQGIFSLGIDEIKACGTSYRKAQNLLSLANKVINGAICLESLKNQSDEQVVKTLISLDGVGLWTAEMTLMFSLERQNVFSYGDFGIKKGLCLLYGLDKIDKKTFEFYRQKFSPCCTIASFYLWDVANKN